MQRPAAAVSPPSPRTPAAPAAAFARFVAAVRCGRVIPFLGAGVSLGAAYIGPGDKPTTQDLTDRLSRFLHELAASTPAARNALEGALGKRLRPPARLASLGLPWLAEQVVQLDSRGHCRLCEILEIERFAHLEPTAAHRYVAFLARERLISEIITTNFDSCIEKAFAESVPAAAPLPNLPALDSCKVVADAGGNADRLSNGHPLLTVYKINGDASAYSPLDLATARRIALTELDLQAWHGEGWAQRLFAARIAQHALALSGFGAEEAQVRFAAAALAGIAANRVPPAEVATQPTAPFVQEFKPQLNRFQQQVLHTFFKARADDDARQRLPTDELLFAAQSNAFTGEHRAFFREPKALRGLTADRFWAAVFAAVWHQQLVAELSAGHTESLLSNSGLHLPEIIPGLCATVFANEARRCDYCALLALEGHDGGASASLPLSRCIAAMLPEVPDAIPSSAYFALGDHPLPISLLVLFWAWSRATRKPAVSPLVTAGTLGLKLSRPLRPAAIECWLVRPPCAPRVAIEPHDSSPTDGLVFVQIAFFTDGVQYLVQSGPWVRPLRAAGADSRGVFQRRGIQVDALPLLELAAKLSSSYAPPPPSAAPRSPDAAWRHFCRALDEIVDRPWKHLQAHLPSIRDRTSPLEPASSN